MTKFMLIYPFVVSLLFGFMFLSEPMLTIHLKSIAVIAVVFAPLIIGAWRTK